LEETVAERTHELTSLLEVSRKISGTLEREPLLAFIFAELQTTVDFSGAAFYAIDDEKTQSYTFPEHSFQQVPLEKIKAFIKHISSYWALIITRSSFVKIFRKIVVIFTNLSIPFLYFIAIQLA
jgi:hypothetical protein